MAYMHEAFYGCVSLVSSYRVDFYVLADFLIRCVWHRVVRCLGDSGVRITRHAPYDIK